MKRWHRRRGQGKPSPLDYRPNLPARLTWYLDGFVFLSRRRANTGFGVTPISLAEMQAYLDLIGVTDPETRESFARLASAMDTALMEWLSHHA